MAPLDEDPVDVDVEVNGAGLLVVSVDDEHAAMTKMRPVAAKRKRLDMGPFGFAPGEDPLA
jgi:hypothetical protein